MRTRSSGSRSSSKSKSVRDPGRKSDTKRRAAARARAEPILRRGTLSVPFFCAGAFLVSAILCGGSSRFNAGDAFLQISAATLIAFLLSGWATDGVYKLPAAAKPILIIAGAAMLLPLLYDIPLPATLWAGLPGRDLAVQAFAAAGQPIPVHGIGLKAGEGVKASLSMLPPLAAFLMALILPTSSRRWLVALLLVGVVASLLLGVAQIAGGAGTPLRFHDQNSLGGADGFFANRNHLATMLILTLPLAASLALHIGWSPDPRRKMGYALVVTVLLLCVIGVGLARSRAGVLLLPLSLIGATALLFVPTGQALETPSASRKLLRRMALLGIFLCVLAGVGVGVLTSGTEVSQRFDTSITSDDRAKFLHHTLDAARLFAPIGSGPATFTTIYPMLEPQSEMREAYVNHAHDEYAETWLEYGIVGIVILASLLIIWAVMAVRLWLTKGGPEEDRRLARAASVGLLLIWLHSFVDYPMRTATIAVIAAVLLAMMITAPPEPPRERRRRLVRSNKTA